ncbi:MAG: mercury methylation corrinoid protein HgcA [Candidatus Eisenbacteria bacterium]
MDTAYIIGWTDTAVGRVPKVATDLTRADRRGSLKANWSIGRMKYTVAPGLYAVGNPDRTSPVLVTANYKLSFDSLRRELAGLDAWIMVLDTKGINVWCAAGKGTFGTQEILDRIERTRLGEVITHRRLILPQLGAPGVAAHEVRKGSGFSVTYGPVRARDVRPFLDAGMVATLDMRRVRFATIDRLRQTRVEFVVSLKYLVIAAAVFLLLAGIGRGGYASSRVLDVGFRSAGNLLLAYLGGVFVGPVLLPWLPGRAFSLKGLAAGLGIFVVSLLTGLAGHNLLEVVAWAALIPTIASFLTMNFTGASTYTSLSGVKREMRIAVPLQIAGGLVGVGIWLASRFVQTVSFRGM